MQLYVGSYTSAQLEALKTGSSTGTSWITNVVAGYALILHDKDLFSGNTPACTSSWGHTPACQSILLLGSHTFMHLFSS